MFKITSNLKTILIIGIIALVAVTIIVYKISSKSNQPLGRGGECYESKMGNKDGLDNVVCP